MPDHSFSKEFFPNIQSKPPLMQLEAIASCPTAGYLGEETNTCLTTTSFQVAVDSNKVCNLASSFKKNNVLWVVSNSRSVPSSHVSVHSAASWTSLRP